MLTAMKSQMNPHFIFNALNTIQSYIYTNNRQKASSYLGKFSNLIRIILASSSKKNITLTEEIETLQLYIDLEEMRFEDNFSAQIVVDEWLNTDEIYLPPMLVQPYIENAIKHGLLHKEEQRILKVSFKNLISQQSLGITIEDNGIGRERSGILNHKKNSGLGIATSATEKRIDILNHALHNKIKINVIDKINTNGQSAGTIVNLTLPNELLKIH
jgi:LytS/YehU family sensor histidine kinase